MKDFLSRFNMIMIISCYSALVLALYTQLNIYIVIFGVGCAAWRLAHYFGRISLMGSLVLSIIALASTAISVLLTYPLGIFNVLLHLIFLGFSLKFLELRSTQDMYFFVNTGFVLIGLFFIFNSTVGSAIFASLLVMLLLALLLSLHLQTRLKKVFVPLLFKTCLVSLPLALLLFVIMPRLPSLWKMPLQKQATTGLSDRVSPGEIASLSRSSALAFRATFEGARVPKHERYWRAMTLDSFDGKSWFQSAQLKLQETNAKRGDGRYFHQIKTGVTVPNSYQLIVEPHYNYWVPVLDYSLTPQGLVSLRDYSLRSDKPIVARRAFSIDRISDISTMGLPAPDKLLLTRLPTSGNKKTDQWIDTQQRLGVSNEGILQQLLTRFSQNFRYTLAPPLLGDNHIDDFLFNTQAGFCVHYASSYLYVARKLGIPARMVTGYLGGEWQASQRFFSVRQYDAHAWVEIWLDNHWQRVDPTAYVAPERVESGLEASLSDSNEFLADEYFSLQKWHSVALLNILRTSLAQIDYLWARYVVNFDHQSQRELMQRWLAQVPWLKFSYALLIMMATIFSFLLLITFKPWQRRKLASEDSIYLALQKHFQKSGITREEGQTVSDYCLLLAEMRVTQKPFLASFATRYNTLKYQPNLSKAERNKRLKQLQTLYRRLIKT